MPNERRSETPVADTRLRSEINISVFLQGAMLLIMSGGVGLIWEIRESVQSLALSQERVTTEVVSLRADLGSVKEQQREHGSRIRVLEIDHAKGLK